MIKSCYFSLCRVHDSEIAKQTHLKFETFCENGGRDNAKMFTVHGKPLEKWLHILKKKFFGLLLNLSFINSYSSRTSI